MHKLISMVFFVCFSLTLQAREIAGITFHDSIHIPGVQSALKLNGLGIRTKFFFKIYIAALYVQKNSNQAQEIISSPQAKRMVMHILYDEVDRKRMTDGWLSGFKDNLSETEFTKLKPDIEQFNTMFETTHAGDIIFLDFIPGYGCRITIKGQEKGTIKNPEFYPTLLKIWLGEEPISSRLKRELLKVQ